MSRGARKAGLSRRHRFVGRGAFTPALSSPRKIRSSTMQLHVVARVDGASRIGVSLPKRIAPRSVDRNRLKRIVREAFRQHAVRDRGFDLVLTSRSRYLRGGAAAWRDEFVTLLDRAAASA